MWIVRDDIAYLLPIAGGQEEEEERQIPIEIETLDHGAVYSSAANAWTEWLLTAYRPRSSYKAINFNTAGIHTIVSANPLDILMLVSIALTVDDETDLTLYAKGEPISGPFDFGGKGEPRGIVIPFPYVPLDCGRGGTFQIGISDAVQVSGTVCYILI